MLITTAILIDGIVFASYLFLVSIGLTLIFGVMKILNAAHGSFYAFGAYGAASLLGVYFSADNLASMPEETSMLRPVQT